MNVLISEKFGDAIVLLQLDQPYCDVSSNHAHNAQSRSTVHVFIKHGDSHTDSFSSHCATYFCPPALTK